jgi:hypothetical protein
MNAIEQCENVTPQEFMEKYQKHNKPVLLKGAALSWKERWTPETLKERHGSHPVIAESKEPQVYVRTLKTVPLADLIETVQQNSLDYRFRSMAFLSQVPDLQSEFQQNNCFAPFFPGCPDVRHQFWITPTGNTTMLHHDSFFDNLNVQIYGRKHFVLIPPSAYKKVHPHLFWESLLNPLQPDYAKYPRFKNVELYEAIAEPGDLMFIPQLWWHYVTTLDLSINLNAWAKAPYPAVRKVTATMPLVPRTILRATYKHEKKLGRMFDKVTRRFYGFVRRFTKQRPAQGSEASQQA